MHDLVSIVIPCYNASDTIGKTIESALNQRWAMCEVIVVDDGSSDGSPEVIASFGADLRVSTGPNAGVSHARNLGTEMAKGDYVQYLDSDDLLGKDTIERRVEALVTTESDVAYTDWQKYALDSMGRFQYLDEVCVSIESVDPDPQIACATSFWVPPVAALYRRHIVDAIGCWNESLPIVQDARFLFDAAYHGARFVRVPGVGAYYRTNNARSLSNRNKYSFVVDVFENANQIRDLWEKNSEISNMKKETLSAIYDYVARKLFKYDERQFNAAMSALNDLSLRKTFSFPVIAHMLTTMFGIRMARKIMFLLTDD